MTSNPRWILRLSTSEKKQSPWLEDLHIAKTFLIQITEGKAQEVKPSSGTCPTGSNGIENGRLFPPSPQGTPARFLELPSQMLVVPVSLNDDFFLGDVSGRGS
jgi:hypothetical protein